MIDGQAQAGHGVGQGQEAPFLFAPPEKGQRMTDDSLAAEAVDGGAEALVEIEAAAQARVIPHLGDMRAEDDALHDICRPDAPDLRSEMSIVRVMHFALVIPTARLPRERQAVHPPAELDIKEALGDGDIGRAVFAHGADLNEVRFGHDFFDGPEQVEIVDDIVLLGPDAVCLVDHRVGRRGHLAQVHDGIGLEVGEAGFDEVVVGEVANAEIQLDAEGVMEGAQALFARGDGLRADAADFGHPLPPQEQIGAGHFMTMRPQINGQGPAEVAVYPRNEYAHGQR